MGGRVNLDMTFLIDLHREQCGRGTRGARQFLESHPDSRFHVSVVAAMEFLEGFADCARGEHCLGPFKQVVFDDQMARRASRIRRELREKGMLIGDLDILIAATAMQMGEPLVTANEAHFQRVSGLECISYR